MYERRIEEQMRERRVYRAMERAADSYYETEYQLYCDEMEREALQVVRADFVAVLLARREESN